MAQPKPKPKTLQERAPWRPAEWEVAEAGAIQALLRGDANPDQQRLALKFIIEKLAGTYDAHYFPGQRDTDFALGKAHVGQQIVKLTKLNLARLTTGAAGEHG